MPAMPEAAMPRQRTLLGFDYGRRRIGVATGQESTHTANALTTLNCPNQQPDWIEIGKLIDTWKPDALVIGVPYHMDGGEHEITQAARRFGRQLHGRFHLPVYEMDERLSSHEAESRLQEQRSSGRRKKGDKKDIDKLAAQIILQDWLEQALADQGLSGSEAY
jgi:putative Holliday junction resolvase